MTTHKYIEIDIDTDQDCNLVIDGIDYMDLENYQGEYRPILVECKGDMAMTIESAINVLNSITITRGSEKVKENIYHGLVDATNHLYGVEKWEDVEFLYYAGNQSVYIDVVMQIIY